MKKYCFLLTLILLVSSCTAKASQIDEEQPEKSTITLLFAGDLMQHGVQFKAAQQPDGSYDYEECFRYITDEIRSADVAIANFETTVAGGTPTTYPQFNSPDEWLYAANRAGFDILLTANNHSVDKRAIGITRTIQKMDEIGVPHIGTYANWAEREKEYPYILEKNGFRIAILCYTYGTNGIRVPEPCVVNLIDTVQIKKDIQKARSKNPDCIIACMHWGIEHALTPNQEQTRLADFLIREGVDHVIGGHPHVIQPIEIRDDKHVVAYSLGNYISNMSHPNNDGGMMVKITLEKNDSITKLANAGYSLTWVSRPAVSHHKNYRIYPVSVPMSFLNAAEQQLFNKTVNKEREIFQKYNKNIKEYSIKWNSHE